MGIRSCLLATASSSGGSQTWQAGRAEGDILKILANQSLHLDVLAKEKTSPSVFFLKPADHVALLNIGDFWKISTAAVSKSIIANSLTLTGATQTQRERQAPSLTLRKRRGGAGRLVLVDGLDKSRTPPSPSALPRRGGSGN